MNTFILFTAPDEVFGTHRAKNDLYDTDAMSIAVPYCAVVVADKAAADALRRVNAGDRHGTFITRKLEELAELLPAMTQHARTLPDPSGWEAFSPGVGFNPATPEQLAEEMRRNPKGSPQASRVSRDLMTRASTLSRQPADAAHTHGGTTSGFVGSET